MSARVRVTRTWLKWSVTVAALLVIVSVVLIYQKTTREANLEFDRIARMSYEDAQKLIAKRRSARVRMDSKPITAVASGLQPGTGVGVNPRFINIGKAPAAVYRGPDGEWFILGRVQVLDYVNGRWKHNCVVENQKFIYEPAK